MRERLDARGMALCALFTALISVGAFIKIPVPVVPFTLQYLFTMLSGLLLGPRLGAASVGLYLLLGLLGLPVFAEGGGFWYVLKPSFGYLLGFAAGAWLTGHLARGRRDLPGLLRANFAGLTVVYALGMAYYYGICRFVLGSPIGLWPLILYCFLLAVPGDICLCFVAAELARRLAGVIPETRTRRSQA